MDRNHPPVDSAGGSSLRRAGQTDLDEIEVDDELLRAAGVVKEPERRPRCGSWRRRGRRRRGLAKRATVLLHRWTGLTLGMLLVLITTTGAIVLYTPEWKKWTNEAAYRVTSSPTPMSIPDAVALVDRAHPRFDASSVNVYAGAYEVSSADGDAHAGSYVVDPGSGQIRGLVRTDRGFMALMNQVHECMFTCEEYPLYLSALGASVPTLGMSWLDDVTWGGLLLGVSALLLVLLSVSGIWLWWPGVKKWAHGFRVRMRKGRYARDYDLHQVIGMAALPFLLMWGITGANFEFHWVSTAWYAVTGGQTPPQESFTSTSAPVGTADIDLATALRSAQQTAGPTARVVYVAAPAADDLTATYDFWFSRQWDPYAHGASPGEFNVDVDRHDAARTHTADYGIHSAPTVSNLLLDDLGTPTGHYGVSVNGWWRTVWFAFGLTPLLLMVTGISTWLAKRSVRRRRRIATSQRAATSAAVSA